MATALLGHIEQFDPAVEKWTQYVERLEQFFVANDIVGEGKLVKRRATFLSVVGPTTYNLLRSLIAPAKPTEKTFEQLVEVLATHYSPKPTEVMQRFRFNSRARKEGESIAEYVAELRRLAEHCNYGDSLNKMLRDRLVWGVKDTTIQKKLLGESELTLDRAIQLAQSTETAEQNVREMGGESQKEGVHKLAWKQPRGAQVSCSRCGGTGHRGTACPFQDRMCYKCKRVGHFAKMCRKPSDIGQKKPPRTEHKKKGGRQPVRQIEFESESLFRGNPWTLSPAD